MWSRAEIPYYIGEVLTGIFVGLLAHWANLDLPISALLGFMSGALFFLLRGYFLILSQASTLVNLASRGMDTALQESLRCIETLARTRVKQLTRDSFLRDELSSAVKRFSSLIEQVCQGKMVFESEAIQRPLVRLLQRTQKGDKIFATSLIKTAMFWRNPQGDRYRQVNFEVANRGVNITRVFIERAGADKKEREWINEEIKKQMGHANITLKSVNARDLTEIARRDMLLVEGKYVVYLDIGTGEALNKLEVYTDIADLQRAQEIVEEIERTSHTV